ncbi:MAG: S-layer homology domain-containing protein [Clostridia bacterium]|nr:S-layer homology domain-containing protein [Clostridia bacterium]
MKKTFLKIISLVLCALIALPCVPGAFFTNNAYASDEIIALTPTDDTWTGDATAYVVSVQGVQVEGASSNDYQHIRAMGASAAGDLNTARYASAMSYMKFDMSDYTDVKIDSAKLKLYAHSSRDPENGVKLYFFKTDSNWSEDKLTYNVEAPIVPLKGSDLAIDVTGTNIEGRIQPDLVSPSFNLVGSSSGFKLYEFDLTDLVKKYNLKSDSDMSFAFIAYPSPYAMMIASKDNENEEIRPTLEISTSPVEPLEVVSSPAQEMLSTDDVAIEFNNILDASTVSVDTISLFEDGEMVDLTEEDFVINENVLTITKEKVPYCDYELVISEFVSDIYGNSLGLDLSFAFSCMPVNSSVTLTDIIQSAHLDPVSPNNTRMTTTPFYFYAGGNYYPYYVELDMSDYIGKNLSRVTYDIKFESANQYFTVYFYDVSEDFDPETVTYATAPTLGDHLFSRFVGINSGTYVDFDLTSFVNEKLKTLSESDPYIRFALKPGASTTKLYSDFASNSNRPKITIEYTDSSYVGVKSTIPANDEVGFSVDADVVIEFSGSVDGADSSNFVLKNLDKNEEIVIDDSQITYDDSTNTVTISFPDSLDELTSYELTVSGITAGENVVKDKKIRFSTASRIDISDVTVSGTIDSGSIITASVDISNNTEVSSIGPALIAVLYDGKGKMLDSSVAGDDESISENEEKTLEASLTVPENITDVSKCYVKAFVWDNVSNQKVIKSVVLSGDEASADSMRGKLYGEITIEGNLSDSPNTDISLTVYDENNKICHYNQVVSDSEGNFAFPVMFDNSGKYTAYVNSDVHFGSKIALDPIDYTAYSDYKNLWEEISSGDKTRIKKVLGETIEKFEFDEIDFDITQISDDVAASVSDYDFPDEYSDKAIADFESFLTDKCTYFNKVNSLLKAIDDAKNQSTLTAIFTDEENAEILGITSYISKYKKNKTKVNNALVGKKFDSLDDFQEQFKKALESKDEPSGGAGGGTVISGGNGNGVAFGVTTIPSDMTSDTNNQNVLKTEENYFTDLDSVLWAKDEIEFLYRMGVINGRSERIYAPSDNVLREEFVKLIMEASELKGVSEDVKFADVPKDSWYYNYVSSALKANIVSGISDTHFGSGTPITRQDICVMTVRALDAMGYQVQATETVNFSDSANISDYAKDAVAYLAHHGIVSGNPDGTFLPLKSATRAETACIIYRTLEHIKNYASTIWKEEPSDPSDNNTVYSFSTPTQAQIKADIETVLSSKNHPYLFADAEKLKKIKQSVVSGDDEYITRKYSQVKKEADRLLSTNPTVLNKAVSQGCISIRCNVLVLMTTYYVEGDEKYLQRAMDEFENLRTVENWNSGAQLDNTMTAEAIAFCYDWLYDHLSAEQRQWAEKNIKENCLSIAYEYYKNPDALASLRAAHANMNIVISRGSFNHTVYNNSNLIVAALALAKTDPDYSAFIISNALYNIEPYWELVKDGGFEEPATYYHYCTGRASVAMNSLQTALGTMYGYDKSPGFKNTAWFGLYMYGPMTFGDAGAAKSSYDTDSLYFLAKYARNTSMMKRIIELDAGSAIDALLAYDKGEHNNITPNLSIPLDRLLSVPAQSTAVFRNHGDDKTNIFTGLYAGKGTATGHSDPVSGLFCLDVYGERFITALGAGDYNLPGYWDNGQNGQRWTYYERRTEGGNCLVINPGLDVGQDVTTAATITKQESSDGCAYAIADLQPVYHKQVEKYQRGLKLHNNRTAIVVQDEAVMKKPSEIFWSFNTPADIEIVSNDTAILSVGDKKVAVKVYANVPYELYKMKAESLPTSPKADGQKIHREYQKLAIKASDVTELKLMVEITPFVCDRQMPNEISEWIDLENWTATEQSRPIPELDRIYINGTKITNFNSKNFFYEFEVGADGKMPEITVDKTDSIYAEVIYPDELPGNIDIEVSDGEGNLNYYTVGVRAEKKAIDISKLTKLTVSKIKASDNDGNVPENAIDGSLSTRWSASGENGDVTLDLDLGSEQKIKALGIAFYSGSSRKTYFEIETSVDGKKWTKQIELGESSGKDSDFEYFELNNVSARYVRYVGQQNSQNHWNSVTEMTVYAQ